MRRHHLSALGALTAVAALIGAGAAPASAATGPDDRAVSWLSGQLLADGGLPGVMEDVPDWGLTIDAMLAAVATGAPDKPVNQMWQGIRDHATEYAGPSYGTTRAGASAKVLLAALVVGEDPTRISVDGSTVDFVAQTSGLIEHTSGTRNGRLRDEGGFDNANIFGQSLAVMAFSHDRVLPDHREDAQALVDHLLTQQCSPGYWRMFSSDGKTCEQADPGRGLVDNDGTAIALMALRSADRAGLDVPDDAITRGLDDLERRQKPNGAFGGGVSTAGANSNSTGLAGSVLSLYGRDAAASRARGWVAGLQVTGSGLPDGSGDEVGAIAYNESGLADGRRSGIGVARDQWRRATAQAVLALTPASYGELSHDFSPAPPPSPSPKPTPKPRPEPSPGSSDDGATERPRSGTGSDTPASGGAPEPRSGGPSAAAPAAAQPGAGPPAGQDSGAPQAAPGPGAAPAPAGAPQPIANNVAGDPQRRPAPVGSTDAAGAPPAKGEAPATGVDKSSLPSQEYVTRRRAAQPAKAKDESPIGMWVTGAGAVLVGGGAGAAGLLLTRRKRA